MRLHQQLKCWICGLRRLDNLPKHLDVEMPDQPLPIGQNGTTEEVTSKEEEEEEMAEVGILCKNNILARLVSWNTTLEVEFLEQTMNRYRRT
ncbi:ubiquitin-conjugating enzyme E2 Q2-like [Macaca fascicularis]|uniref:ubiquitin-conjugating enzyme E2 Q2-like n=1 Tax=Macaca fascicularis TaxID=9541 RepID=UPI001E255725|nr:ubiquitin-conjugating enzyme E2 Q2-like [Macaca fascicularis]